MPKQSTTEVEKSVQTEDKIYHNIDILVNKSHEALAQMDDFSQEDVDKLCQVIEKVGEDNINMMKDKVSTVASNAKDKVNETVGKIFNGEDEDEDIFEDEDINTSSDNTPDLDVTTDEAENAETEDDVTIDDEGDDDEFLTDELKDL